MQLTIVTTSSRTSLSLEEVFLDARDTSESCSDCVLNQDSLSSLELEILNEFQA